MIQTDYFKVGHGRCTYVYIFIYVFIYIIISKYVRVFMYNFPWFSMNFHVLHFINININLLVKSWSFGMNLKIELFFFEKNTSLVIFVVMLGRYFRKIGVFAFSQCEIRHYFLHFCMHLVLSQSIILLHNTDLTHIHHGRWSFLKNGGAFNLKTKYRG